MAVQAHGAPTTQRRHLDGVVRERAGAALAAGIDPASRQADTFVAAVAAHYARLLCRPGDAGLRRRPRCRARATRAATGTPSCSQ
ncbi:hypothetical protein [Streptomyces collinus]|uniref:hypothetical protein n=1 Tax=Streptomyces collinus TaxID=42684 RepID=UPI0036C3287F